MNIIWVLGIALIGIMGSLMLRRFSPETAQLLPLAALLLLFFALLPRLDEIVSAVRALSEQAGIPESSLSLVLRGSGICLITRIASGICTDCGQKNLGEVVDYCGQIAVVSLAVPLVSELAQQILAADF